MVELFGKDSRWEGSAGGFSDVGNVRRALLAATTKIRRHLKNVLTSDNQLFLTTAVTLDSLDVEIRGLRASGNTEIDIIGNLVSLVAYLLGFDWYLGKTNRQVVYFQTLEQQYLDDAKRGQYSAIAAIIPELEKRKEIASKLWDDGLSLTSISSIMRLYPRTVKDFLVSSGRMERKPNATWE